MMESKYFNVGKIVSTRRVHDAMEKDALFALEIMIALEKFRKKDWGQLNEDDWKINDEALNYPEDLYLLAAYPTRKGKIWIITNRKSEVAGDNVTTVMFPEER